MLDTSKRPELPAITRRRHVSLAALTAMLAASVNAALAAVVALATAAPGAAATAPAPDDRADSATPEAWTVVALGAGGEIESYLVEPSELGNFEPAGLRHAWAWRDDSPPRRLEARHWARQRAQLEAFEPETTPLEITVAGVERATDEEPWPPLELIGGPATMWLEVPESLLPRWTLAEARLRIARSPGEAWRLRLVGPDFGSRWVDVEAEGTRTLIAARKAPDRFLEAVGEDGEPLPEVGLTLRDRDGESLANFRFDDRGTLRIDALPSGLELGLLAIAPHHAAVSLASRSESLPRRLRMPAGGAVSGRLIDEAKQPVAGVRVHAEAWSGGGSPIVVVQEAKTGEDGRFHLDGLARGEVALGARAEGRTPLATLVELDRPHLDLGDVAMPRGRSVQVRIVDERGEPVPGATVEAPGEVEVRSDHQGLARLEPMPAGAFDVEVEAQGHLDAKGSVAAGDGPHRVEIQRAFTVLGYFTNSGGVPVREAQARVTSGRRYSDQDLAGDGSFELTLAPGKSHELRLRSPETDELRLELEAGDAGTTRDLGELRAPPSLVARGRVVDEQGRGIAGARLWTLRAGAGGEVAAWLQGDDVSGRSGEDGVFELRGLPPRPAVVRVEAAGYARHHLTWAPPEDLAEGLTEGLDLGKIVLRRGLTVRVVVDPEDGEGALARLDLLGRWRDGDMLVATVHDGEAVIDNVPPGRPTLTVLAGRELLCEEPLQLEGGQGEVTVDCWRDRRRVSGTVLLGDAAAGAGQLHWHQELDDAPAGVIINRDSSGGLRHQEVFGAGRPEVTVAVDPAGYFRSERLGAGPWQVRYTADDGTQAGPRTVELSETSDHELLLTFAGGRLAGTVIDEDGRPVAWARVRELVSGSSAITDEEGRFHFAGLGEDVARVQARFQDRVSRPLDVEVGSRSPAVLELTEADEDRVEIFVRSADGRPAAGAFVFLEDDRQTLRVLTADADGRAEAQLVAPAPQLLRVAAHAGGAWAFGDWQPSENATGGLTLVLVATGELTVHSEDDSGLARLESENGWDVGRLMLRLGLQPRLEPVAPLRVSGLPPGSYRVGFGDRMLQAAVAAGEGVEVDFD